MDLGIDPSLPFGQNPYFFFFFNDDLPNIKRFDEEGTGTIAWNTNVLLLRVALMDVVDVNTVCEAFFMAGFKVFDQVRRQ